MLLGTTKLKVEIDENNVLDTGAYGKVCMAKYGQLLCAAKVLHDMFEADDYPAGRIKFVQQQCLADW